MNCLGLISDIHGNAEALERSLEKACELGAQKIICAGDLTGYGPHPKEVVCRMKDSSIHCIKGNYDRKVLNAIKDPDRFKKRMKTGKWQILEWTLRHLDHSCIEYLSELPESIHCTLSDQFRILIVHGSPISDEDAIYPSITREGLMTKLNSVDAPDILVCGHTHIPFVKKIATTLVINCGSVGQPVDGDPRGAVVLLKLNKQHQPAARVYRFDYDTVSVSRDIARSGLPMDLANDLIAGKKKRESP